jgi:hypothetical protein
MRSSMSQCRIGRRIDRDTYWVIVVLREICSDAFDWLFFLSMRVLLRPVLLGFLLSLYLDDWVSVEHISAARY